MNPKILIKILFNCFIQCKKHDCLPMLAFNTDTVACKKLFTDLFKQSHKLN